MALCSRKCFSALSVFTVTLFTVAAVGSEVRFGAPSYTVLESQGYVEVEVCTGMNQSAVENDTGSGSGIAMSLTVYITYEGQSASIGIDFEAEQNDTLELTGEMCGLVNITILDDMIYETNETFIIIATTYGSDSLNSIENRSSATTTVTVVDDENLVLEVLNNSTITIGEDDPNKTVCLSMRLDRVIERSFTVTLRTSSSMETARESEDYTSVSVTKTFNPSSVSNMTIEFCVNINITDDSTGEPNERFTLLVEAIEPRGRVTIRNGRITIIIRDNERVPDLEPTNFNATNVESRSISFSWDPPMTDLNITGYTVNCSDSTGRNTTSQNTSSIEITISSLKPFTNYNCYVFTRVEGNRGNNSHTMIKTAEEVPGSPPRNISVTNKSSQELRLTWLRPEQSYGVITNYTIRINFTSGIGRNTTFSSMTNLPISNLRPHQLVFVMISATNSKGSGPFSTEISFRTNEAKSGPVSSLSTMSTDDPNELTVMWAPPAQPNGVIQNYSIEIFRVNTDCRDSRPMPYGHQNTDDGNTVSKVLRNLAPEVPFVISVRAVNSVDQSDSEEVCTFTQQGRPSGTNLTKALLTTNDTIIVQWRNLTLVEARGWIHYYTIHWWDAATGNRASAFSINTNGANMSSLEIKHAEIDVFRDYNIVVTATTVIGQGADSNVFLLKGRPRQSQAGVIAGTIILLLIIVAVTIVIVIVLIRFRRRVFRGRSGTLSMKPLTPPNNIQLNDYHRYGSKKVHFDSPPHKVSKDIPVEEFSTHVKELHRDSNRLFEVEYRSIKDADYRHDAAFLPCNIDTKNRFIDIFPYDANRVVLKKTAEEGSDYINASWINGYKRNGAYIAAQGPRVETVEDFWRMISENKLPTIVMVTRLVEGHKMIEKCRQYWPEKVGHTIRLPRAGMMVTLKETKLFSDYTINILILKQPHSSDLEITQFFYQGWPDHGVPQYATSLLGFLRHVRRRHPYNDSRPLLVHCSAGVGRTGTFITLDVMLQKIREEGSVNVHEFVKELRKYRCQMVQTESQYVFIHDALNEYITSGDTEIAVGNLRIALNKLYQHDSAGFKKQFQLLSEVSRRPTSADLDAANSELHQHKNRYPEKIPYKDSGVKLKPTGVMGGEYINANFINGYKCINSFVAAQAPLESTVETFWRMVWEIKCQTIVLLCDVEKEMSCVCFWPKSGSATYGKLRVTATSKPVEKNDIVNRKLEVSFDKQKTNAVSSEKLSVTLFHHTEWNEDGDQPSSKSILQLNNDVIRAQISTGNKPIIVACNDGCGRTGTFLSIYSQVERLKTEQVIDVFQWVKSARIQRAWLVSNQEQYELIYEVLSDFIDSFDTYANFQAGDEL